MQRVAVSMVCDMDHGTETPADRTMQFGLDGDPLETDLCPEHAHSLTEFMAGYIAAARKIRLAPARRAAARRNRNSAASIRAWATEHGYQVSERGRIPIQVKTAYEAANAVASS